jgi:tetratricopeptide (TPR) repeat protein
VLGAAAGLVDKSLLLRAETSVPARPLYRMLEAVRAYAALELAAAGEREDALEGLVRYCTQETSLAASGLVGVAQIEWLNRVREDLESYRAALAWLIDRGRPAEAAEIAWRLWFFWLVRGHAAEGLRWYEQTLRMPALPPAAELRALVGDAAMSYSQGELVRARTGLTRALALTHGTGDEDVVLLAESLLGNVEHAVGNMTAARDLFAHSVEGFQALGVPWGIGNAMSGLAWVALASGELDEAEHFLDEAASVLRHAGPWFLLLPLYLRAILAVRSGNPDRAIALVRDSLAHIRPLHDKFAFVYALVPLAAAAVLKGDDAWAARIMGARDAVTESTGATAVDKSVHDLREEAERKARARLGPERWARAYARGRTSSIDAVMKDIDSVLGRRGATE